MRSLSDQAHASGRQRKERYQADLSQDGGIWCGPAKAAWMKRLLRGAPPPQESAGTRDALVAHG